MSKKNAIVKRTIVSSNTNDKFGTPIWVVYSEDVDVHEIRIVVSSASFDGAVEEMRQHILGTIKKYDYHEYIEECRQTRKMEQMYENGELDEEEMEEDMEEHSEDSDDDYQEDPDKFTFADYMEKMTNTVNHKIATWLKYRATGDRKGRGVDWGIRRYYVQETRLK